MTLTKICRDCEGDGNTNIHRKHNGFNETGDCEPSVCDCPNCEGTGRISVEISASQILSGMTKEGYIDKTKMDNSFFISTQDAKEIIEEIFNDIEGGIDKRKEEAVKRFTLMGFPAQTIKIIEKEYEQLKQLIEEETGR